MNTVNPAKINLAFSLLIVTFGIAIVSKALCGPAFSHLQTSPIVKNDYKDAVLRLRRIPLVDGNGQNAYVWQFIGRDSTSPEWAVYGSLYSPRLRGMISSYPRGTFIGHETQSTDHVVIRAKGTPLTPSEIKEEREGKDFSDYCKAHGIEFGPLPVS